MHESDDRINDFMLRKNLAVHLARQLVVTLNTSLCTGRPLQNEIGRQPIVEFRPPSSDFRLPEPPFRQQFANTNFAAPSRTASNNNGTHLYRNVFLVCVYI